MVILSVDCTAVSLALTWFGRHGLGLYSGVDTGRGGTTLRSLLSWGTLYELLWLWWNEGWEDGCWTDTVRTGRIWNLVRDKCFILWQCFWSEAMLMHNIIISVPFFRTIFRTMNCLDTCGKYKSPDEQRRRHLEPHNPFPPCDHHLAVVTDEFPEYDHFFRRATANKLFLYLTTPIL